MEFGGKEGMNEEKVLGKECSEDENKEKSEKK